MNNQEKAPAYLQFNDFKNALQVFAEYDKSIGYELALEISYGQELEYAEKILLSISNSLDIKDLADVFRSDKFLLKFEH